MSAVPSPSPSKNSLTSREMEILSKSWFCMKNQPEIDFALLASQLGMTNPRSAANAFGVIKKKLAANVGASPAAASNEGTPLKKRAAKRKAVDDEEDVKDQPAKKTARKSKRMDSAIGAIQDAEENAELAEEHDIPHEV